MLVWYTVEGPLNKGVDRITSALECRQFKDSESAFNKFVL